MVKQVLGIFSLTLRSALVFYRFTTETLTGFILPMLPKLLALGLRGARTLFGPMPILAHWEGVFLLT
jgi:hypothetical protein